MADHASGRSDESYGYNANGTRNSGSYVTTTNNRILSDGTYTYTYDAEGNRTIKETISSGAKVYYTWDHRDRLTNVTFKNSGGTVTKEVDYVYDYLNRLVAREYDSDGAGAGAVAYQWYSFDGQQVALEFDAATLVDMSHRYVWGPMVDQLLADEQVTSATSGNVLWGLGDNQGTLRDIADRNTGTGVTSVTNHRTYDSWGIKTAESGPSVDLVFGHQGRYYDEATELQNHWNRWLDQIIAQWLSEDPIGFRGGDANLRRFVENSVTSLVDPTGLWKKVKMDVWEAESTDTSFDDLASMVGKSGVAKFAIKPIPPSVSVAEDAKIDDKAAKKAWNLRQPEPCARYDTSYLTHPPAQGGRLSISIGADINNYIAHAGTFFGSTNVPTGNAAALAIAKFSKYGQAPLDTVWIVGHGDGNEIGGMNAMGKVVNGLKVGMFSDKGVTGNGKIIHGRGPFDFPVWEDAIAGKLTAGFWFGDLSTVQFIGCNTLSLADDFAKSVLWTTANARGTTERTFAHGVGEMGWESGAHVILKNPDGSNQSANTPTNYFKMKYWKAKGGGTEYPF